MRRPRRSGACAIYGSSCRCSTAARVFGLGVWWRARRRRRSTGRAIPNLDRPSRSPVRPCVRDAFGLTAIDDPGPLPDPLMSSGSSTRTVRDLSAWAALSIEFAGLLARGDGAATGGHPPQQLLAAVAIADALGVIFTQFASLGHEASHRQVPASPTSDDLSATGGFVALPRA